MKRIFICIALILLVVFKFFSISHSFNSLTITTHNLGKDFIEIINTGDNTNFRKNNIDMYIKNNKIVISEGQNITIHQNKTVLINGDRINNIGTEPIRVINVDGSEIFVAPGVKNRVNNNKLELIKWYEFWK